jgi:hypothetical protein
VHAARSCAPEALSRLADPAYGRSVVRLCEQTCLAIVNSMSLRLSSKTSAPLKDSTSQTSENPVTSSP